jgi:hypothetical protein
MTYLQHTLGETYIALNLFYSAQQYRSSLLSQVLQESGTSYLNMADPQSRQSSSTTPIPLLTPPPQLSSSAVPSLKRESRMTGDELAKALQLTALDASSGSHNTNTRSTVQGSNSVGQ